MAVVFSFVFFFFESTIKEENKNRQFQAISGKCGRLEETETDTMIDIGIFHEPRYSGFRSPFKPKTKNEGKASIKDSEFVR